MLITESSELADFCAALRSAPYIAVDTEFLRERTYHPKWCLVQIAHGDHAAAIDPLAKGIDLAPLRELLLDKSITKVLHAATQDLEIFLQHFGAVPTPIFDTQLAAAVCNLGEQPGYAKLVQSLLGIQLDKTSQATDWALRPLSNRQITYAIGDVTHLCKVYELLVEKLNETDRHAWVEKDMTQLEDPSRYVVNPDEAYKRIKIRYPKRKALMVLKELAAWRERTAVKRDKPRPWIVRDDAMIEIANHCPTDMKALGRVRRLNTNKADCEKILAAVQRALATPREEWPTVPKKKSSNTDDSLVSLLQALLRFRCDEHGVAMNLVATRPDLDKLASQEDPNVPAMHGWRHDVFGADAMALREGRLALTVQKGKVVAVKLDATP